ncbi:MAG TPA: sigma-70 family RNA polymerase sigma factor [Solirubrobacteraceae bacterium]|nr:sigma-70 family RNA polymerase sigma factor [Solirubrobacteraceae bacterium]
MEVTAVVDRRSARVHALDPDAELVAAARAHPREFLALYDRYFERVLGYVRLRIRDAATCEDVTSQVFTTALEQLSRFRGDGSFAGWLFRIAGNAVHDVHRRRAAEPLIDDRADPSPSPEELVLARERVHRLRVLITDLRAEQQHLLALRYGAGLAFEEIGPMVGASPGTARVRLHRILEELRRRYPHDDA